MAGEHILVVDDEHDLSDLVAVNLELEGYRTSVAHDGREALGLVERERPDLLLLDVMMPRLDGWGVLAALQEHPGTRDLPVVMLTALAGERDIIQGYLSGAVTYVTKPFDVRALLESVSAALEPIGEEERLARARRIRGFVSRLAELEAGRPGAPGVRFAGVQPAPRRREAEPTGPGPTARLSARQREVASLLASGWRARRIAAHLGTSRSNVYATRKRIARHLGVPAEEVASEAARLGLARDEAT